MEEEEKQEAQPADSGSLTVSEALKMFDEYKNHWEENYRESLIDLKMANGDRGAQWGEGWAEGYTKPAGPAVVINELPQYIHQVTNDIRQNTPSIKAIPEADGDEDTADVFSGLIRGIEYKSSADEAYDTAAEYAVTCAIGFLRAYHDFCDDESDEQELFIGSVQDPLSNYLDPTSVEMDGRDANGHISLENISRKSFEKSHPGKDFVSFTEPKAKSEKDTIVLANIYIRESTGKHGKKYIIRHYKFSGEDLLAETTFPGMYIPYVPIYGQVSWINGKRVLSSLIRQARDPQRRLNHWASKESQILSMAPIAPVLAVEGTIVNERKQWQIPGLENVLEYRQQDIDGNQAPAPIRLQPPTPPAGFINAMEGAKENIKESMGIYNAGLGKREGDVSGIALRQLDQSGDVATFHFPDNVRRSIAQMGRLLINAIPEIYDTPRIIQIVNEETDVKMVGINGGAPQEGQKKLYDLTKGKYHVRVTTGTSYTTKRQEAGQLYGDVIKANPELMNVIGDLWAKNLDVAGAEAMASRLRKMIPPQLLDDNDQQQIPPQLIQKMQQMEQIIQQGAQEIQQLQAQLQSKQADDQAKLMTAKAKLEEADTKKGELKLKFLQAANETGQPNEAVEAPSAPESDDPVEVLQAKIQHKLGAQQQADMLAQQQAEQQAADAQQKAAMEAAELQLKQQDIQLRAAQGDQVIQALGAIVNKLGALDEQAAKPIMIMRDANGVAIGAQ